MKLARALLIVAVTLTAAAAGANALARLIGGERGVMAGVIAACLVTLLTSHWQRRPRRPRVVPREQAAGTESQEPARIAA